MNLLVVIWVAAAVMSAIAIAWMSGLILMRVVHERRTARRLRDRKAVEAALIGVIQGRADLESAFAPYRGRARLLSETLLDFLSLVRGEDRQMVVGALEHLGADRTLRQRIERGSVAGRLASVEALGAFPGPETQFALIRASARGEPAVRLAALRSLWQAGGEVRIDQLVGGLEEGAFPPSGALAELLRLVTEADPSAAIAALETPGRSSAARLLLAQALGAAGAYAGIPALMQQAEAPEPEVRTAAVEALGRLMHPAGEPILSRALSDTAWEVRSAAADAVGDARLTSLIDPLAERLSDPIWRVRHQAAAALAKLGPPGLSRLEQTAKSGGDLARRAAALVLEGVA